MSALRRRLRRLRCKRLGEWCDAHNFGENHDNSNGSEAKLPSESTYIFSSLASFSTSFIQTAFDTAARRIDSGSERLLPRVYLIMYVSYAPVLRIILGSGTIFSKKCCRLILEYLSTFQTLFYGLKLGIESRSQKSFNPDNKVHWMRMRAIILRSGPLNGRRTIERVRKIGG